MLNNFKSAELAQRQAKLERDMEEMKSNEKMKTLGEIEKAMGETKQQLRPLGTAAHGVARQSTTDWTACARKSQFLVTILKLKAPLGIFGVALSTVSRMR